MNPEQSALINMLAAGGVGAVWQWALFGPKKIPNYLAWSLLGVAGIVGYLWANPNSVGDFSANWRLFALGVVQFVIAAKGSGSGLKAIGLAPATDSK